MLWRERFMVGPAPSLGQTTNYDLGGGGEGFLESEPQRKRVEKSVTDTADNSKE